jgi:hypothetical protein
MFTGQGPHAAFPEAGQRCDFLPEMNWARNISRVAALRLMLAVVLMLQVSLSATAMARMEAARFAPDGAFVETVICTADGMKTVQLPSGTPENDQHPGCECPCAALCAAFNATNLAPVCGDGRVDHALPARDLPAPLRASRLPGSDAEERPGSPRSPPFAA